MSDATIRAWLDRGREYPQPNGQQALDTGCGVVSWEPYGDTPVKAGISRGGLFILTGWAEP